MKHLIKIVMMIFSLSVFGCGNKDSLKVKLKELEYLHSDLSKNFGDLHKEIRKYAEYGINKGWWHGIKYYSRVELKINGYNWYLSYCDKNGPDKGLLAEAQKQLRILSSNKAQGFDELMQDNTQKTQLNLCYNYAYKEKKLNDILLNIHDAMETIRSEIELAKTDIKLKNLKESQLVERINQVLMKYQRSNYEFHDVNANPNYEILRVYWEKQITGR
jgi:hypothetical protein